MLFFSIFPILSLCAFVVLTSSRIRVTTGRLGAGFILWISYSAISGRLLSALGQLDQPYLWLAIELLPVIATSVLLREDVNSFLRRSADFVRSRTADASSIAGKVWVLPLLVLVIGVYYSVGLIANIALPQTMDDSLTAYLARAGFWISSGSIDFFETSSYNFPLVSYPALPTLSTVRWIVLTGTDHMAALDQWIATLVSATLVYAIGRRVRLSAAVAAVIAMIWLLTPVTLLQSQMVLNDMVAMVAILTAILMSSHLFGEFRLTDCAVAVIACFVAIGTKQTVLFMAPSAFLALAVGFWVFRKNKVWKNFLNKHVLLYGSVLTLLGLFMSFPEYYFNQMRFGHPLGPSESFGYFADSSAGFEARVSAIGRNSRRVLTAGGFGDVPLSIAGKFPGFYTKIREYYPQAGSEISRISGVGWYGFAVTLIVLMGLSVSFIVAWKMSKLLSYFLLTGGAVVYAILFMYTRPNFSEAFSRYMLLPITLLLIAGGFAVDALLTAFKRPVLKIAIQLVVVVVVGVAAMQGAWSFFGNGIRPLAGTGAAWNLPDDEVFMLSNGFEDRGAFIPMLQQVNECMKDDQALAVALPYKFPLSMVFGYSYKREVTMINNVSGISIDAEYLQSQGYSGIILHDDVKNSVKFNSNGLWNQSYGPYTLLRIPIAKQNCG